MLFGSFILLREVQPWKASEQISVTLSGIVTLWREVHKQNASEPILVTLSGMVTLCRDSQALNALLPISEIPSGMIIDLRLVKAEETKRLSALEISKPWFNTK